MHYYLHIEIFTHAWQRSQSRVCIWELSSAGGAVFVVFKVEGRWGRGKGGREEGEERWQESGGIERIKWGWVDDKCLVNCCYDLITIVTKQEKDK